MTAAFGPFGRLLRRSRHAGAAPLANRAKAGAERRGRSRGQRFAALESHETARALPAAALVAALVLSACGGKPPAPAGEAAAPPTIRVATFNAYLNRPAQGGLIASLSAPDDPQAKAVAEIIQRAAPDLLLLQEFDYDAEGRALALFQENYLGVSQNGAAPIAYPYLFLGATNTGVHSGHDLDRDGAVTSEPGSRAYGGDAFGYGDFPGQYGMVLLSKYPIDEAAVRTFRTFLWKDMPHAMLPDDPATPAQADWYSPDALAVFRLSSKSHWDAPVIIGGARLHVLASHPTPPVFDGEEDRNGRRNHDEIRFWADYISPGAGGYIYDDESGRGGLAAGERFVILGDMNADPMDGDGVPGAAAQLLDHPAVSASPAPESNGGAAQAKIQGGANLVHGTPAATDTADFGDDVEKGGAGNLRLDYVLPSKRGVAVKGGGVFWPAPDEEGYALVGPGFPVVSSDHRLVWIDIQLTDE
ncbi:MAG: endonuclease/exonuclease/phosphatase family protein [Pseudomonadota bacterium]|nr:endonuclease/exonuclease/phosphatase family protein [Pseudomonadota bacterium]